jgi:acetyltransferase EpsM
LPDFIVSNSQWVVAIGDNKIRQKIVFKLKKMGYSFATAIHPSAQIGLGVKIDVGTVIMANVVINTDTYIGSHVILNTGATIDHDCYIADYCHIAPGCSVCGGVKINQSVLLGVGSQIKPCLEIGENTILGAGSTIVKNMPSDSLAYGCPAKIIKKL